jgi:hypothetical protein
VTWASRWAAVLVLAVAAVMDPWGLRPFTTLRWAVVGVAAAAAAASTRWQVPKRMMVAWLALLGLLALATALALDPLIALLGHPRRHLGLLGWLVSALAFAAGTGLPAEGVRRVVARAGVVAGLVTGASVLADLAGWDPAGTSFAAAGSAACWASPPTWGRSRSCSGRWPSASPSTRSRARAGRRRRGPRPRARRWRRWRPRPGVRGSAWRWRPWWPGPGCAGPRARTGRWRRPARWRWPAWWSWDR